MVTAKTTAQTAKALAKQITKQVGADNLWSENPVIWWSNMFNSGNTLNTFFTTLTDLIISQRIKSLSFENPLAIYKGSDLALGLGEVELYFNPKTGRNFTTTPEETFADNNDNNNLLLDSLPDVREVFYRLNYGKQYQNTYSDNEILNLVASWENFASFIDGVSRNLTASANIEEYETMRNLFANGYDNGFIPQTQINAVVDEATANAFLVKARAFYNKFLFPSTEYNAWSLIHQNAPVKTWSTRNNISIVLSADAAAVIDVLALASAFNLDKAELIGKVLIVDKIDTANKIFAVMFDDTFINVKDKLNTTTSFFNPATLKLNMYLTRKGIMSLSPFSNAIAFTTYTYTLLDEKPTDWDTAYYTKYFTKRGESYALIEEQDAPPIFVEDTYYTRS